MDENKLKVVIADDESLIVTMIRMMIDWDMLGLEVVGECASGTGVLEMIKEKRPDIVITDICMPGLDGLEMINRANHLGIPCEYLLISGHKNFEYAHTAVKYGIRNYLLKPINQNELYDNLLDIKQRIFESYSKKDKMHLWDRTKKNEKLSKMCFIQDYLSDTLSQKAILIKDVNEYYLTNFETESFLAFIVTPHTKFKMNDDQRTIILEQIEEYFNRYIKPCCIEIISNITKQIFFLVNFNKNERIDNILHDVFENAKIRFSDYCMLTLSTSRMYDFPRFEMVKEANDALCERLDRGLNYIIEYNTIRVVETDEKFFSELELKTLANNIEIANQQACKLWFEEKSKTLTRDITANGYVNNIHKLINFIADALKQLFKSNNSFEKEEMHDSIYYDVTRESMFRHVGSWLEKNLQVYINESHAQSQWYIRISKEFIADNYMKNISLNDIEKRLHINQTYFSGLFKKSEGISFTGYLTGYRMNIAKTLLKNPDINITQIGCMVGYDDSSYFSKTFNKVVGIRPKEYRRLYL